MSVDLLTALVVFAFATSIAPGPNTLMLMASGANFGFWRTIPHMMGVGLGFVLVVMLVGVGLSQVFDLFPVSYTILKAVSIVYLLYLAWRIATAAPARGGEGEGKPLTFLQAALFQWVNPKVWAMGISAVSAYAPSQDLWTILQVAIIFGVVHLPTVSLWTVIGQSLSRLLSNARHMRMFNIAMALLLVASLYPVIKL